MCKKRKKEKRAKTYDGNECCHFSFANITDVDVLFVGCLQMNDTSTERPRTGREIEKVTKTDTA